MQKLNEIEDRIIEEAAYNAIDKLDAGDTIGAFKDIDKVIDLYPDMDLPYLFKGIIYLSIDSIEKSKEFINKAFAINDTNPTTIYYFGEIKLKEADYKEAEKYYKKALKLERISMLPYFLGKPEGDEL